jgi:mono/diheme cytochrome c family protein
MLAYLLFALASAEAAPDPEAEAKVQAIMEDACTSCHDAGGDQSDPGSLDLTNVKALAGRKAIGKDKPLVDPGNPDNSYLLDKVTPGKEIDGVLMPLGGDPLPADQLAAISSWISSLPAEPAVEPDVPETEDAPGTKPFRGTDQIVLPTTTTLGKLTMQYRIDHRFGRVGTERGAFGLDAGVVMSMGLGMGILDGWDVYLRRTNSRKGWELSTKYVPVRQEEGMPLSFGLWASVDWFRDFNVKNPFSGNFMAMLSRLWFDRWSTMLTVSYHIPTNHNSRVFIDFDDGMGPVPVNEKRGTFDIGIASTVWLGKRKKWGLDLEWFQPIPASGDPDPFYYNGGDADRSGLPIGSWAFGGSYYTGKHFFQVFVGNNREIHPNLAAPGGLAPVDEGTTDPTIRDINLFLGFNLARHFSLGVNAKRWKREREAKKKGAAE